MEDFKVVSYRKKKQAQFPYGYKNSSDVIKILDFVSQITVIANNLYAEFIDHYPTQYALDLYMTDKILKELTSKEFDFDYESSEKLLTTATFGGVFRRLLLNEDVFGGDIDVNVFTREYWSREEFYVVCRCFELATEYVLKEKQIHFDQSTSSYYRDLNSPSSSADYSCAEFNIPLRLFKKGNGTICLQLCSDVNNRQNRYGFPCDMTYDGLAIMSKSNEVDKYIITSSLRRENATVDVEFDGSVFTAPGGAFLTQWAFDKAHEILSSPNRYFNPGTMWFPEVSVSAKSMWKLASKIELKEHVDFKHLSITYGLYKLYLKFKGWKIDETIPDDKVVLRYKSRKLTENLTNDEIDYKFDIGDFIQRGYNICERAQKLASMGYLEDDEDEGNLEDPITTFYLNMYRLVSSQDSDAQQDSDEIYLVDLDMTRARMLIAK